MKIIFLFLFFSSSLFAFDLESGFYECIGGNNSSICPQSLKVQKINGKLDSLAVYYSGDCADQGPFVYGCQSNGICEDANIRFTISSPSEYFWENLGYNISCNFHKKAQ